MHLCWPRESRLKPEVSQTLDPYRLPVVDEVVWMDGSDDRSDHRSDVCPGVAVLPLIKGNWKRVTSQANTAWRGHTLLHILFFSDREIDFNSFDLEQIVADGAGRLYLPQTIGPSVTVWDVSRIDNGLAFCRSRPLIFNSTNPSRANGPDVGPFRWRDEPPGLQTDSISIPPKNALLVAAFNKKEADR